MPDTYPDVVSGSKLLVQIGNGATPTEVFTHRCMINTSRSINFTASMITDNIPPCPGGEDDDAPAWTSSETDTLSCAIEGSGYFDAADDDFFFDWVTSGEGKNSKFKVNKVGASTYTGKFKCTNFAITGAGKGKTTATISLINDGPVTRTTNT